MTALALLPAHVQASTAKEHAPNSDGHNKTGRWYGQKRNRFMIWQDR